MELVGRFKGHGNKRKSNNKNSDPIMLKSESGVVEQSMEPWDQ